MVDVRRIPIKGVTDLTPIRHIWKNLEKGNDMTVFQSYEWNCLLFEEWLNSGLEKSYSSVFVYIATDNEFTELVPIIVQRKSTKTKWTGRDQGIYILGYGSYSDYLNIIYDKFDENITDALLGQINSDFTNLHIHFTDVREDVTLSDYLKRKQALFFDYGVAVSVKKCENSDEYNKKLSKHVKQNLRTSLNRMKRDEIDYEIVTTGPLQDKEILDNLLNIHIQRMKIKNTDKDDIIHNVSSAIRKIIRERKEKNNNIVYKSMQCMDNSCCVMVKLNGAIAGYIYGFYDNGIIRVIQNCVDEKYTFYSPMFRGIYDFIINCYEKQEIKEIDFTRGDEEYKYKLGGEDTKLFHFVV